jgi:peroxiredoxin Q/BCP
MTLNIGDPAPEFSLANDAGDTVSLADFSGSRVLMYFYPKAFTPGCTTQACDLRDRYEVFESAGYSIVGISPDPIEKLAEFRAEHNLPFPMLSDPDHAVAAKYGAWGTKKNYGREYEGLIRSTFVVGADGVIEQAWRNTRASGHGDRMVRNLTGDED